MPRRPRVHLDRIPLHIVQRGHNREPCFFGEEDYSTYLHWLGEALKETSCSLHAYALMTNHVHLLLTPKNAATVPKLVISLGRRYVQYINRQYRRTGTLWDSRYKSSEFVKKPTTLGISCSGGARNPRVFQHTLRFLRSGGGRPPFARDGFFTNSH